MNVLGIGTDITECLRIAQMIERHGELFVGRVYTPAEIEYCRSRKQATQHFAGRWAAKEAILKALGTGWRGGSAGATSRSSTPPGAARGRRSSEGRPTSPSSSASPVSW
jgi:phosphopantetheine--protein transferase-like protein